MYVPLPDLCSREQILQLQFKKTPIADDVQIDELAKKMEGYSGAEVCIKFSHINVKDFVVFLTLNSEGVLIVNLKH